MTNYFKKYKQELTSRLDSRTLRAFSIWTSVNLLVENPSFALFVFEALAKAVPLGRKRRSVVFKKLQSLC